MLRESKNQQSTSSNKVRERESKEKSEALFSGDHFIETTVFFPSNKKLISVICIQAEFFFKYASTPFDSHVFYFFNDCNMSLRVKRKFY
jgi:hypothetical protein